MRYALQCSSWTLVLLAATTLCAQETKAPWWKFGRGEEAPAATSNVTPAPTMTPAPETITPIEEDSWFAMPKWQWPTFASETDAANADPPAGDGSVAPTPRRRPRSRFDKPEHHSRPRNTWAQQPASAETQADNASTWESMKTSTRNAWTKTVDFVTPGDETEPTVVASKPRSSWWQKMWGSDDRKGKEGPQTITEWMAQDRIDP